MIEHYVWQLLGAVDAVAAAWTATARVDAGLNDNLTKRYMPLEKRGEYGMVMTTENVHIRWDTTEPIWKWLLSYANRLWDYPHGS